MACDEVSAAREREQGDDRGGSGPHQEVAERRRTDTGAIGRRARAPETPLGPGAEGRGLGLLRLHERFDVIHSDLVERATPEERDEVHAQEALVVEQCRPLQADPLPVREVPPTSLPHIETCRATTPAVRASCLETKPPPRDLPPRRWSRRWPARGVEKDRAGALSRVAVHGSLNLLCRAGAVHAAPGHSVSDPNDTTSDNEKQPQIQVKMRTSPHFYPTLPHFHPTGARTSPGSVATALQPQPRTERLIDTRENESPAYAGLSCHGASRARTGDLLGAIQALSQLSYSPAGGEV